MNKNETYHYVSSSSGILLRLNEEEYAQYQEERLALDVKFYRITRQARGIWAGNQDKYVKTPEELNEWDSKYMEEQHAKRP